MSKDLKHMSEQEQESTIFSEHKSSVQIAQEKKEAKKKAREQRRLEKANKPKLDWKDPGTRITAIAILVMVIVIVGGIVLMVVNNVSASAYEKADSSASFYSEENPELSADGIKGVITEAYYTNNGSLAVLLTLSNGLNADHYLTELTVKVENENGEVIADGYTDTIPEDFFIKPQGYNTFLLYIKPEHVKIKNDDLNSLSYEISTVGEVAADAVSTTASSTTASSTTASTSAA